MEHRSLAPDLIVSDDYDACGNQRTGEPAPNVAHEELREEKQMGGAVNCSDSELSIYLQGLEAGFLPIYYSDTSLSVQLKSMSIASKSYQRGKKTVVFHGFPSLQMSRSSTASLGEAVLTWFREGFRVKTSAPQGKEPEFTETEAACGAKWRELSARYDRDTFSWRTHRCLWEEVLPESSVTLPRWGSMRGGELSERITPALPTSVTESGLWPTPTAITASGGAALCKWGGSGARAKMATMVTPEELNGPLNPLFVEWLMGWPLGWTDLKPLEMGKFRQWLGWHGRS